MTHLVNEDQISEYEENGAVCVRGVFSDVEVTGLQDAVESAMKDPGPFALDFSGNGGNAFFADVFVWTRIQSLQKYVISERLGAIAGRLMGARRVQFFFDHLLVKEPGVTEPTPWHQDAPYWPIEGDMCCTIWIALDRVTRENGLVEYVSGSHASGRLFAPKSFYGDDRLQNPELDELPDIEGHREEHDIVGWDLEPGDVAIHHYRTIHGAAGNHTTATRRRGLATRWIGEDIIYRDRPAVPEPLSGSLELLAPGLEAGKPVEGQWFPQVWSQPGS